MKLINGHAWLDLEPYLNMQELYQLDDKILYNIAKNAQYIKQSTTSKNTLFDTERKSFREEQVENVNRYPEFNSQQIEWLTKLTTVGLGSHLMTTGIKNYPRGYNLKHTRDGIVDLPPKADFQFLFDWIDRQEIFTEYGRATFWISNPNEVTALHTDYGDLNSTKKDMFLWITGVNRKKLKLYDEQMGEVYSTSRAGIFNNCNWHCGAGDSNMMSWSFRVDGIFSDSFLNKTGLREYFKDVL